IERGQEVILANRSRLFSQREYQNSRHPVQIADVRCVGATVAIADGKWELRLQEAPPSTPGRGMAAARSNTGRCTLVLVKNDGNWAIDAWRYSIDPPAGADQPVLLAKP